MHFHNELSFADFDQALEGTVLAINTGLWRTRDGTVIERSAGKARLKSILRLRVIGDSYEKNGTIPSEPLIIRTFP